MPPQSRGPGLGGHSLSTPNLPILSTINVDGANAVHDASSLSPAHSGRAETFPGLDEGILEEGDREDDDDEGFVPTDNNEDGPLFAPSDTDSSGSSASDHDITPNPASGSPYEKKTHYLPTPGASPQKQRQPQSQSSSAHTNSHPSLFPRTQSLYTHTTYPPHASSASNSSLHLPTQGYYAGPAAFAPPFYNRPPTPLPPSPSLTSLLRPTFSTSSAAPSRPTTPGSSSDTEPSTTATATATARHALHAPTNTPLHHRTTHLRPTSSTSAADADLTTTATAANSSTTSLGLTSHLTHAAATAPTTIPLASPPVPTYEYYGFALYLSSSVLFAFYLTWSMLPTPFLHTLGIYYYPERWWALAVPAWLVVLLVWIYVALASWNTGVLTVGLGDVRCLVDRAGVVAVVDKRGEIVRGSRSVAGEASALNAAGRKFGGAGVSAPAGANASLRGGAGANANGSLGRRSKGKSNRKSKSETPTAPPSPAPSTPSSSSFPHRRKREPRSSRTPRDEEPADEREGLVLPWRELWCVGTDAVMDVPVGGVCEVLYGGFDLDEDGDGDGGFGGVDGEWGGEG